MLEWKGFGGRDTGEAGLGYSNAAALKYNIPYAVLNRHVKCGSSEKRLRCFRTVFNNKHEKQLVGYLQFMDSLLYGLMRGEFEKNTYDFSENNRISRPFQNRSSMGWLFDGIYYETSTYNFLLPEPTSVARSRGNNHPKVIQSIIISVYHTNFLLLKYIQGGDIWIHIDLFLR
jgi:hypothetical protein